MENILKIEGTEFTPKALFDKATGVFEITGRSLPEDAPQFYDPINEWLEEYVKDPNPVTEFLFKLDYYNSASAKEIVKILKKIKQINIAGKEIKIIWYYSKYDELMKDRGEEIKRIIAVPFELRTY